MNDIAISTHTGGRPRRVLCAPYHLYTHSDMLAALFDTMSARAWDISLLLPFTAAATLETMRREAEVLPGVRKIHDFTWRALIRPLRPAFLSRLLRALALVLYGLRAAWLVLVRRPDALVLTSDLGGVSVRFVQLVSSLAGVEIFTLQSTLFLKVAEREDLKFEFRPRWLHRLLSRGVLKKLFLFFGEVPGTFLSGSYIGVQDDEIRRICIQFGKRPEFIKVCGSLQAAKIRAARMGFGAREVARPRLLLLSECISERYGEAIGLRNIEWMRVCAARLDGVADITVRFHPREPEHYRIEFLSALGSLCSIDPAPNAVEAAAHADIIVGAYSMLMFDAQAAGIATIFLDVGDDPLGFYNERRTPLASSAEQLAGIAAQLIAGCDEKAESGPANPEAWVDEIIEWIAVRSADRRRSSAL